MAPNQQIQYNDNHMERNLQRFLSMVNETPQQLNQTQSNRNNRNRVVRMGALRGRAMTFAYAGREAMLDRAIELLDPELRPIPPQPNCAQSMQIYEDHRRMASDYVEVKRELSDLQRYKAELLEQLNEPEVSVLPQEEVEKYARLKSEKEALLQFKEKLSTQLQLIKKAQGQDPNSSGSVPSTSTVDDDWVLVHDKK